jgi:hypothetical protein
MVTSRTANCQCLRAASAIDDPNFVITLSSGGSGVIENQDLHEGEEQKGDTPAIRHAHHQANNACHNACSLSVFSGDGNRNIHFDQEILDIKHGSNGRFRVTLDHRFSARVFFPQLFDTGRRAVIS